MTARCTAHRRGAHGQGWFREAAIDEMARECVTAKVEACALDWTMFKQDMGSACVHCGELNRYLRKLESMKTGRCKPKAANQGSATRLNTI